MHHTWENFALPETLVAFQLPAGQEDHRAGKEVVLLMEFLLVELLGTHRHGFNNQPGGPYTFSTRTWLPHDEARAVVQELGLRGEKAFREWCKENKEERLRLGIPYNPERDYADWIDWYNFCGTTRPASRASD